MMSFGLLILAGFVSWAAWALMISVGVLHSVGAISWTLGYDEASVIAWCVMPVSLFRTAWNIALSRRMMTAALDDAD